MADATVNPRRFYVYVLFRHDTGAPFYVGKGQGNRVDQHYKNYEQDRNRHKAAIIRRAVEAGSKITSAKLATELTEPEAFEVERYYIQDLGRRCNGGVLVNLTDGGDGVVGYVFTAEDKAKMSASRLGKPRGPMSEDQKQKLAIAGLGRVVTDATRAKLSVASKGAAKSPEFMAMPGANKGTKHRPESIRRMIAAKTGTKCTIEHRTKLSEALRNRGPITAETSEKLSAWQRGRKRSEEDKLKMRLGWAKRNAAKAAAGSKAKKPTEMAQQLDLFGRPTK